MDSITQKITNGCVPGHDDDRYIYDHLNANGYGQYCFNYLTYLVLLVTFDFNYCWFD